MHPTTRNDLETLATWTVEVVTADRFAVALQAGIPERADKGSYATIDGSFGNLSLNLYEADNLDEITPYLHHVRTCGFKREGIPEEDGSAGTMTWRYFATVEGQDQRQQLTVRLYLKQEGASCRYVEIGKKEVPDMKLMCGEELAAWDAENPPVVYA